RIDVETVEHPVEQGDRILLCTDGLTRYFGGTVRNERQGPAGAESSERLQRVVGRLSADSQALANQLTADGRGELYDDGTPAFVAPPLDASWLPPGGAVLVQRGTGRLFVLRTRPVGTPSTDEPITLSELRVQPGKVVKDTGNVYRLDVIRGRLIDPSGHTYPVT